MSVIIDSRQTFFDADGTRLSGGRLRFYVWGTTTPATVYSDLEHTTPITGSLQLTSAGWAPFEVYSSQDLDVRADKFIGLDEYGVESYQEVKSFRYTPGGTGSASGATVSMAVVESIADLRELPTTFSSCMVLGYHVKGDCPARTFINVSASAATDNSGTVIGSTQDPTMRWIWTPDCSEIDCRTFGVIPSASTTINSQLSTFLNYCDSNKSIAYLVNGAYQLAPGSLASNACIHAQNGVSLRRGQLMDSDPANWYHLTLTQPCTLPSGLAGSNVRLVALWDSSRPTLAPMTAWDPVSKGFEESTGLSIHLDNGSTAYDWTAATAGTTLGAITAAPGSHSILGTAAVTVGRITEGPGQISYTNQEPFTTKALRTSCLAGTVSKSMAICTELATVDTTLSLLSNTTVPAIVHVVPGGTMGFGSGCRIDRGVVGYPGCLIGANGFASDMDVAIELYSDPNAAMDSWNRSSASNFLDLKSRTVTRAPAKSGRISNGVIQADVTAELILDNVTFVGSYDGPSLRATNCHFEHKTTKPIGAGTHSTLTDCSIKTVYYLIIDPDVQTKWTRVAVSGRVVKKGNGGTWRDVSLNSGCYFVPDADGDCGNFSWVGGAATSIHLDCSQRSTEGACILFNFEIRGLIGLAYGIKAMELNTTAKYWAPAGHFNVRIGDNEGGPATYGTAVGTQTAGGDSSITIAGDTSQILWLTNSHSYDQVRALGRVTNINALAPASGAPSWSGEGGFVCYPPNIPFISGSRTRGDVGDNTRCTYNFEVYHRTLT